MSMRHAPAAAELPANEAVVVHAASRILAALIRNGRLTEGNHMVLVRSAVQMARELAREAERRVQTEPDIGGSSEGEILDLLD
jgi:hypothetical protein